VSLALLGIEVDLHDNSDWVIVILPILSRSARGGEAADG
jgi:hypothetical protein